MENNLKDQKPCNKSRDMLPPNTDYPAAYCMALVGVMAHGKSSTANLICNTIKDEPLSSVSSYVADRTLGSGLRHGTCLEGVIPITPTIRLVESGGIKLPDKDLTDQAISQHIELSTPIIKLLENPLRMREFLLFQDPYSEPVLPQIVLVIISPEIFQIGSIESQRANTNNQKAYKVIIRFLLNNSIPFHILVTHYDTFRGKEEKILTYISNTLEASRNHVSFVENDHPGVDETLVKKEFHSLIEKIFKMIDNKLQPQPVEEFLITKAVYSKKRDRKEQSDVTQEFIQLFKTCVAAKKKLEIAAHDFSKVLGKNPFWGYHKVLIIEFRYGNKNYILEADEYKTLVFPPESNHPGLKIKSANFFSLT